MHEEIRNQVEHAIQCYGPTIVVEEGAVLRRALLILKYSPKIVDEVLYEYKVTIGEAL